MSLAAQHRGVCAWCLLELSAEDNVLIFEGNPFHDWCLADFKGEYGVSSL